MARELKKFIQQLLSNNWKQNLFVFATIIPNVFLLLTEGACLQMYEWIIWIYSKEEEIFTKLGN